LQVAVCGDFLGFLGKGVDFQLAPVHTGFMGSAERWQRRVCGVPGKFLLSLSGYASGASSKSVVISGDGDHRIDTRTYAEKVAEIENSNLTDGQKDNAKTKLALAEQIHQIEKDPSLSKTQKASLFDELFRKANLAPAASGGGPTRNPTVGCLAVPYYPQANKDYCGPATTRQTLGYFLVNPLPDQTALAGAIGGVGAGVGTLNADAMRAYINSKIPVHRSFAYMEGVNFSMAAMNTALTATVLGSGAPPILRMKNDEDGTVPWRYKTGGHYLNVSGKLSASASTPANIFEVTDPACELKHLNEPDGKYPRSVEFIHNVTHQHSRKSFWW